MISDVVKLLLTIPGMREGLLEETEVELSTH